MKLAPYYPNVVEFPLPLRRGDMISNEEVRVLEVRSLRSTLLVGGIERKLFVAIHEKRKDGSMMTLFVSVRGRQIQWTL